MTNPSVASYSVGSGNSTLLTTPYPTGISSGNILLYFVSANGAVTSPSGWTKLGDDFTIYKGEIGGCFYKTANGLESGNIQQVVSSGRYCSSILNISNATGVADYRQFNERRGDPSIFTPKVKVSGSLIVSCVASNVLFNGSTDFYLENCPYNSVYHSGASLYFKYGNYGSGYAPPVSLTRGSGTRVQSSGYDVNIPSSPQYCGMSVCLK